MARKKAKRKAPTRNCEGCGTPYFPRSAKCPSFGLPNPVLNKSGRRGTSSADAVVAAIDFVEQAGSVKAAWRALDTIERLKRL